MSATKKKAEPRANAVQPKARPVKEQAVLRVTSHGPNVKRIERLWLVEREIPGGSCRACTSFPDAKTWANHYASTEPGSAYVVRVFVPEVSR